ncbi:thiamine biosynthesis protein ApbE [Candidatus Termititenax persephonae]|uniref:FAD:protein FMN transferase n=1 Tax=Candidatus Termititenax persephonae TaxID=2218525 RepID=A0A388TI69_9BACT|nr:thiamine biosynthesis protein ApbE [Candidatus Termititenax persephonae]
MLNEKQRIAAYVLLFFLLCWGFDHFLTLQEISASRYVLHTLTEVKILCRNKRRGRQASNAAFAKLKELEAKFNYFDPASELSQINREAYGQDLPISAEMRDVLALALSGSELSGGAFDITTTPLTRLYGFGTDSRRAPQRQDIQEQLTSIGWKKVRLDTERQTVRLLDRQTQLDLGGIAKGYAVDQAVAILRQYGIRQALVNAGGNIYALGQNRGKPWRIGIRHPRSPAENMEIIELRDAACATSGDYEQYFIDDNQQRYAHIFNPQTGRPANLENNLAAVTVIADTAARADMLSTACFVLGEARSAHIPEKKIFYKAE